MPDMQFTGELPFHIYDAGYSMPRRTFKLLLRNILVAEAESTQILCLHCMVYLKDGISVKQASPDTNKLTTR
ncbi:hypothetical protein TMatcc_003363 [Talaromyces marneffei ATCC 18224]